MSVRNGNRCKHPAHQIGMDLPLGQPLHGKRHTNNPNEYGVPAARAHGGGRSPDGQFRPRELLGQGRGAKQSLLLSNKPFFSSPPPSRQERCRRRRSRPHPMPAHGAVAVPWGNEEHLPPEKASEAGARGRGAALPGQLLPPSRRGSGAEWGRWRLPGFWLRSAMELGRRCHGSLRFNRAAAAPR